MTTPSPNVTRIAGSGSGPMVRSNTNRWRTYPPAAMTGTTTSSDTNGLTSSAEVVDTAR